MALPVLTCARVTLFLAQAPEQFNGRLSEKSDIYSLGMVLWECWCNERPWSAAGQENQIWQVMYRLIHQSERPEIPDNCPSDLADIICSCWRTDPKARPSAVDVKNCLWGIIITEMNKLNEGPKRIT